MTEIPGLSHISLGSVPTTREGSDRYVAFRRLLVQKVGRAEGAWIAKDDLGDVAAWYVEGDEVARAWAMKAQKECQAVWDEVKARKQASRGPA